MMRGFAFGRIVEWNLRNWELTVSLFVYSLFVNRKPMICAMSGLSVPQYDTACD